MKEQYQIPETLASLSFKAYLQSQLARRCSTNSQYSLRSFAMQLEIDHSTLSQLLRGKRRLTERMIRRLSVRLPLSRAEIDAFVGFERLQEPAQPSGIGETQRLLRDTLSLISNPHHLNILELVHLEEFRPDARWIARLLDITTDEVNIALSRLLRLGLLEMSTPTRWTDKSAGSVTRLSEFITEAIKNLSKRLQGMSVASVSHKQELVRNGDNGKFSTANAEGGKMGQPVMQWQIMSKDPDRLSEFYNKLFSWTVDAENALGYRQIDTRSERGIKGGIWPSPPDAPAMVQLFVEVDDITECVTRAVSLGANIIVPPQALPDGDEMAVITDPDGLPVGLMKGRKTQVGNSTETNRKGDS